MQDFTLLLTANYLSIKFHLMQADFIHLYFCQDRYEINMPVIFLKCNSVTVTVNKRIVCFM